MSGNEQRTRAGFRHISLDCRRNIQQTPWYCDSGLSRVRLKKLPGCGNIGRLLRPWGREGGVSWEQRHLCNGHEGTIEDMRWTRRSSIAQLLLMWSSPTSGLKGTESTNPAANSRSLWISVHQLFGMRTVCGYMVWRLMPLSIRIFGREQTYSIQARFSLWCIFPNR
jgi:hypothetical protein